MFIPRGVYEIHSARSDSSLYAFARSSCLVSPPRSSTFFTDLRRHLRAETPLTAMLGLITHIMHTRTDKVSQTTDEQAGPKLFFFYTCVTPVEILLGSCLGKKNCQKKQLRARVEGSRWRPSSFGWSPLRRLWPRTKVLRVPALTAPTRAHHRYDFAPARYPSPEPAQRTAGVLPVYWPEFRLLAWVVSAAKTPLGVAAPPITTTAKGCPLQHPPGFFKFQPNSRLTI
eukprot:scaffold8400_cov116-Isochrysis_galbana.AAC.5